MLAFIHENLEKSDQLTRGMVSILSSFESRLLRLECAVIPVHTQTGNLQRLQDHVDRALSCLDHVIGYYHVAKDTEKTIWEGPTGRLEEYLLCMAEIQKAVEFFQDNNPDSPELNTVKALFEKGQELLEAEFRALLTRCSRPVPPQLVLRLLGEETREETQEEAQEEVALEHLPGPVLRDMVCISSWLIEHARNQDFLSVYFQVRSVQLAGSLKGLRDFRRNSPPTACPSPALQARRKDTPTKRPPRRPGKDEMQDVDMDSYICCVSAFVRLALSEHALLAQVIPEQHQKKTFDSLIQEALDGLMLEGESIVAAARRAISRHDYTAVLTILPILRHLKQSRAESNTTLQGTASSTKNKLPNLIVSMETIGAKALEEFADSIKNDPDKEYNMPKDGTVHELASNVMLFLQQLLDFQETAGTMLASQVSESSCSSEFGRRVLSSYICKALGNLQLNLLSKSKVYEYSALSAIFLLNNYNYILKSLEKSELIQLVAVTQQQVESSYQDLIQQQVQVYQRSWWRVLEYLMDRNTPTFQPGHKLKDKERQLIKDKFKGFNEGLEELCKVQNAWAIPDTHLRDALRHAQKSLIAQTYRSFLHRYANISFTKNLDKYLKYRPEQVEEMIGRLFDTSA
ncbi:exocyst complex component 7-like isoform X2 [Conger conger]|nr:exocyst complex component 7-like isoform X2 [Conger conger]